MLRWCLAHCVVLRALCVDAQTGSTHDDTHVERTTTPPSEHLLDVAAPVSCRLQPNGFACEGAGWLRPRFYYDLKLQGCKTFSSGGCAFNLNSFATLADCHAACPDVGALPPDAAELPPAVFCRLQHDFGHCNDYQPRWYYDVTARRCRGFSFSGCGGNRNRFASQQACAAACGGAVRH